MTKIAYVSLSASSWQRAALLDSALNASQDVSTQVTFFQSYRGERVRTDLPFSSSLDYLRARWQDRKIGRKIHNQRLLISSLSLPRNHEHFEIDEEARKVGLEETIVKTRDSKPCHFHASSLISNYAQEYVQYYKFAKSFFELQKPDVVFLFNGRFYREKAFWRAATDLGIKVNFIERFSPAWGNRYFEFTRPVHNIEYRCSVMESHFEEFVAIHGLDTATDISSKWFNERIAGIGQKFTALQDESFERNRTFTKQIVFFHSSEDELFTTDLGSNTWTDQITFLQELVNELHSYPDVNLLIRLHPNLKYKSSREIRRWSKFADSISSPNVTLLKQDSPINSYDILKHSDVVITFGSTIGVEARYLQKTSILVSRAFHELLDITINVNSIMDLMTIVDSSNINLTGMEIPKDVLIYGLFHANGGISFRYLRTIGDKASQDPAFEYQGVNLGSLKTISLVRRIEGFLYRQLGLNSRINCEC